MQSENEKAANCRNCKGVGVGTHLVVNDKGKKVTLCDDCYGNSVILKKADGTEFAWYTPQPHQRPYHESDAPNLLALGTRGTGKSTMMRKDAIIRCMRFAGFKVLILRRTIPDLRKSHLRFINQEMVQLSGGISGNQSPVGYYRETTSDVVFKNGSFIQFSHCETVKDVENYLSSEWDLIIFDELSTFTLDMFLKISAAARSPEDAPYKALVRAGSNPLGIGAFWMKQWFVDHNVNMAEYPDYLPDDFEMQFSTLDENQYVNRKEYEKRLRNVPEHIRKAWLHGEFIIEGAYFTEFQQKKDVKGKVVEWHVVEHMPTWRARDGRAYPITSLDWVSVYRAVDWGYFPDPAVCLWIAVLPNHWAVVFKERSWNRTLAKDVAKEIKRESIGMHVVTTFCDPTMFIKRGDATFSVGEQFEQHGVPLDPAQNDRELYGYAVHEYLADVIDDHPKVQIVRHACPELIRTIPILQMDANDPRKIADGPDHWVVAFAYFCMGQAMPTTDPVESVVPRWMRPKRTYRPVVG